MIDTPGRGAETVAAADCLTVVVPAFNEAESLGATVEEILQTFAGAGTAVRVIVVDDGSTDTTADVARALRAAHPEAVTVETHPRRLGLGAALRTGFAAAQTRWVGLLPADGQFRPEDMLAMFGARGEADAVAGDVAAATRTRADSLTRLALSWSMRVVMRTLHPAMPRFNGVLVARTDRFEPRNLVARTGVAHMEVLDRIRRRHRDARIDYRPITLRPRRHGRSKSANMRTVLAVLMDFARLRTAYLLGSK